eukprot:TRINITY_DN5841_c0_g1_i1.p1 TRINITY_DN5841_c0_g1~~TRINITY_DN5841_c0_g1_i1.p1  ORF type:complete len:387 (+),score=75.57 TRINITY_DN5841_c0_g1_i1:119-1162(+)
MSILELGHRSPEFEFLINEAQQNLRNILNIPQNYKILFMQGGGTGQFSAVPLNLLKKEPSGSGALSPLYLVTGRWSERAYEEAKMYGTPVALNLDSLDDEIPSSSISPNTPYVYYCDNETVHGVEFTKIPSLQDSSNSSVVLVSDMSSNFLTRKIEDIRRFGIIYSGAQKNIGIPGLVIVIVRDDLLLVNSNQKYFPVPTAFDYKVTHEGNSLVNTPPTFAIYIASLMFKWVIKHGGIDAMEKETERKSKLLYDYIIKSSGNNSNNPFYQLLVENPKKRSRVNVVFRLNPRSLEPKFVEEAKKNKMVGLEGHRSVGGIRVSLYNAITFQQVQTLVSFMEEFKNKHSQ